MAGTRDAGRVVIVGGGLAGYSAATQLRALGHDGSVVVVDPEPASYDRPPLSKDLFSDDFSVEKLAFATADELAQKSIDTIYGQRATALDAAAKTVTLSGGDVLEADTILIATGGRARALPIPGFDLPGVQVLREFADAWRLREQVSDGTRVAVVGAGLIGAELASALHGVGAEVTLIDPAELPILPAVGPLMAQHLHGMHAEKGLTTIQGLTQSFEMADDALEVVLGDGARIPADIIVVGVGIVPNSEIAAEAGLEVDNGIIVGPDFATAADGIYAVGDVARLRDADGTLHRREEHWEAAQLGGQDAAHAMLGLEIPTHGCMWFWSDRHGIHLEGVGRMTGDGEFVVRPGAHPAVFLVDGDLLVGAAVVDDTKTIRAARRLIDQRIPVTAAELADPDVALRSLLKARR